MKILQPKVSIIMPVGNATGYVKESTRSLQKQNFADWELIIVGNGSAAEVDELIESLAENDSRIKYIKRLDEGVAAARNFGLEEAKGEFIAFLDADDFWYSTFLEKTLAVHSGEEADFVYTRHDRLYPDGAYENPPLECIFEIDDKYEVLRQILQGAAWPYLHLGSALFRKSFFKTYGLRFAEGLHAAEDELLFKAFVYGTGLVVQEILMTCRLKEQSAGNDWQRQIQFLNGLERLRVFSASFAGQPEMISLSHDARVAISHRKYFAAYGLLLNGRFGELARTPAASCWNCDISEGLQAMEPLDRFKAFIVLIAIKLARQWYAARKGIAARIRQLMGDSGAEAKS